MAIGIAAERVVSVTEVAVTVTCAGEVTPVGGVKVTVKGCCADKVPVGPPLMAGRMDFPPLVRLVRRFADC